MGGVQYSPVTAGRRWGNVMPPEPDRRIRNALIELCFEWGFARVTVEDLCRRAGVDLLTFELQYSDLEDCFAQIYEAERDRIIRVLEISTVGITTWRGRLRATAYALFRCLSEDEKLTHFMIVAGRTGGERAQLLIAEGLERMFDLVDEGRGERGGPEVISRATAESIGGGIWTQVYAAVGKGWLPPEDEIIPQMMYTAVLPYLGPQAALEELSIPPPPSPAG